MQNVFRILDHSQTVRTNRNARCQVAKHGTETESFAYRYRNQRCNQVDDGLFQ